MEDDPDLAVLQINSKFHYYSVLGPLNEAQHLSQRVGNTQVTCHMGMPYCGQCHCNTFSYLISHPYYL